MFLLVEGLGVLTGGQPQQLLVPGLENCVGSVGQFADSFSLFSAGHFESHPHQLDWSLKLGSFPSFKVGLLVLAAD